MIEARCNARECSRQIHARGFCKMHYEILRRSHDQRLPTLTTEQRFWSYVNRGGPDDCWLWTGGTSAGYGRFTPEHGVRVRAHRLAYELTVGPIPDELQIDHLCHNRDATCPGGPSCRHRRCTNPAHLEPVIQQVNLQRAHDRRISA